MRIAYIIFTCKAYELSRVPWQKQTVFSGTNPADIYYLGNRMDKDAQMLSWGANDDYMALPYKLLDFFRYSELDYDWYFIMDDDTFVLTERLQKHVDDLEIQPRDEIYTEGCVLTHLEHTEHGIYYSGGAGTLLSAYTFDALKKLLNDQPKPYTVPHWCADISLGQWLHMLPDMKLNHNDNYHHGRANENKDNLHEALTFHHLNQRDDFLCHQALYTKK